MIFRETPLKGAFVIEPEKLRDRRGFFARAWCMKEFEAHGLNTGLVQCNIAFNHQRGTVRGMHFQTAPRSETKLVRCTRGTVYDVIVDLRAGSTTYLKWFGVELTAENSRMLYVPEDFAHGYKTLTDNAEVFYQVSEFYSPECERGVRWDDPALGIDWPESDKLIISEKDRNWPLLGADASDTQE
jgi:dTDP-4-dehydrorhamnose 3,5-epimerase